MAKNHEVLDPTKLSIDTRFGVDGVAYVSGLRFDRQKMCLSNDRGFTDFLSPDDASASQLASTTVYSIYAWKDYVLFEVDNGSNKLDLMAQRANRTITLATDRPIPGPNKPATQYIEAGRYLFIINGGKSPLHLDEHDLRAAFFNNRPTPPVVAATPANARTNRNRQQFGQLDRVAKSRRSALIFFDSSGQYGTAVGPEYQNDPVTANRSISILTESSYQYAVTFISETQAESPLSAASNSLSWRYANGKVEDHKNSSYRHGIIVEGIPKGPAGTMKRRLYRTMNQREGMTGGGQVFYFVTDIPDNSTQTYLDCIPDEGLGFQAPSVNDSTPIPFGVSIGCSFGPYLLLSGISAQPNTILFSKGNVPEQFPAFNYLVASGDEAGRVTALKASDNKAYVFRENGIDIINQTNNPDAPLQIRSLTNEIGSVSPDTIKNVSGVGLVFLGSDSRFYALQGNKLVDLSRGIEELCLRMTDYALPRATATYNRRDNEYWCHVGFDGDRFNSMGFVYSVDLQGWMLREDTPAQCMTQLPEGWTVFGSNALQTSLPAASDSSLTTGLYVWCGVVHPEYATGRVNNGSGNSYTFQTSELYFGSPRSLKTIQRIRIYGYQTKGDHTITVRGNHGGSMTDTFDMVSPEEVSTAEYGVSVASGGVSLDIRTRDKNFWRDNRIVTRVVDVDGLGFNDFDAPHMNTATSTSASSVRSMNFSIEGTEPIDILGYSVEFLLDGKPEVLSVGHTPDTLIGQLL